MTKDAMHEILDMRMAAFRTWSYAALAERVEIDNRNSDCLEHIDGVGSDGTEYQLEFNASWNDKPHGDIRVWGSLSAEPQRRLLGFLPIYTSDLTDSFIMSPDGSFVDEDNEKRIEQDAAADRQQHHKFQPTAILLRRRQGSAFDS